MQNSPQSDSVDGRAVRNEWRNSQYRAQDSAQTRQTIFQGFGVDGRIMQRGEAAKEFTNTKENKYVYARASFFSLRTCRRAGKSDRGGKCNIKPTSDDDCRSGPECPLKQSPLQTRYASLDSELGCSSQRPISTAIISSEFSMGAHRNRSPILSF